MRIRYLIASLLLGPIAAVYADPLEAALLAESLVEYEIHDGSGVIVAIYESETKAAAAVETIQAVWAEALTLLTEPPQIATYKNAAITF